MKILLSNDDGIFAPGLKCLAETLSADHDLIIVAPDSEKSAVSHSLTIRRPLFVSSWDGFDHPAYAVSGTPADCVKLGLDHFLADADPDLVISGINNGANTGINVFYSGTVAAAMEATFMQIPAMAVSVDSFKPVHIQTAARVVRELVGQLELNPLRTLSLLNVNVPDIPYDDLKGIRQTRQSRFRYQDSYQRRESPAGQEYFWLDGDRPEDQADLTLDDCALRHHWVSITPLTGDFNASTDVCTETDQWLEKVSLQAKSCL